MIRKMNVYFEKAVRRNVSAHALKNECYLFLSVIEFESHSQLTFYISSTSTVAQC